MLYFFKCKTTTGEAYVFGLVPGLILTQDLCFMPRTAWSIEAHAKDEIRLLGRPDDTDGSIQHHNERMIVLFRPEQAHSAYLLAHAATKADSRFDRTRLEIYLFLGYSKTKGILFQKKDTHDLRTKRIPKTSPARKSLASWVHNGK